MSVNKGNVYEREKLYNEVWRSPVIQVAKSYGVSNVAIKKICKSMNIPTPPNGYWAKLRSGKKVQKTPLPSEKEVQNIKYGINTNALKVEKDDPLVFLNPDKQKTLHEVIRSLKLTGKDEFCEEVQEHQKVVDEWNKHNNSMEGLRCSYMQYQYRNRPPFLAGVMSERGLDRVYKIIDVLIKGIKQLGYTINDDMSLQIRGEKVEFYIYEKQSYFAHVITPAEIKKMEKYEKEKQRYKWAHAPYIPTEDYLFNGKLLFRTKKASYIEDNDRGAIEDRLCDMFIQLIQQSEIVKKERLAKEELQRNREEEKRVRNLPIITYNNEVDRLIGLLNYTNDFDIAMKIRNFANHLEENCSGYENAEVISWVRKKADWYDPTIGKSDDIFGIRDHNDEIIPDKKNVPYF